MVRAIFVALLVGLVLGGGGGYYLGHSVASGDCARDSKRAQDAAIERAGAELATRSEEDRQLGAQVAAGRVAAIGRRNALETDLRRAPARADCGLDDSSVRLFNDSIDAINADSGSAAGSVPDAVPAAAAPERRPAGDAPPVGE